MPQSNMYPVPARDRCNPCIVQSIECHHISRYHTATSTRQVVWILSPVREPEFCSRMSHTPNDTPPHLLPINARIQLFVHQPTYSHVLPSYDIKPVAHLRTGLVVVRRPDHAFDGRSEDKIRKLVAGEEQADEGAAVCGKDKDFFCGWRY